MIGGKGLGVAALTAAVLFGSAAAGAQDFNPLRDLTSDGTWDCDAADGTPVGAVVIVENAYAFINTDSRVAGYGKIHRILEDAVLLPTYVVIDGPLKDDHGLVGATVRGPANDPENYAGTIFLQLVTEDNKSTECTRRLIEGRDHHTQQLVCTVIHQFHSLT